MRGGGVTARAGDSFDDPSYLRCLCLVFWALCDDSIRHRGGCGAHIVSGMHPYTFGVLFFCFLLLVS